MAKETLPYGMLPFATNKTNMAKVCEVCGKSYQKGNLVPRGIGNRVTRRSTTRKGVNLRTKRMVINGTPVKVRLCASCLKRIKFDKKSAQPSK